MDYGALTIIGPRRKVSSRPASAALVTAICSRRRSDGGSSRARFALLAESPVAPSPPAAACSTQRCERHCLL